ncbi:MAG: acyl-CoA desaturase [Acidimicrobiia bacterium]
MRAASYAKGDFQRELRGKVQERLTADGRTFRGGWRGWLHAAPAFAWFYGSFAALVLLRLPVAAIVPLTCSLGLAMTAGLTTTTHGALHQTLARRRWVNWAAVYVISPTGISARWWTVKHNMSHHAYTNVEGLDDDLEQGALLRMTPTQAHRPWHRFQHLYVWALYPLAGFALMAGDRKFVLRGELKGGRRVEAPSLLRTAVLLFEQLAGMSLLLVVALVLQPAAGVAAVCIGAILVSGAAAAALFAVTHYVEDTEFTRPDASGALAAEWAVTQVNGAVNIAIRNPIVRWYFGGFANHIEHHLFPRMAHVHYRAISPVVRDECERRGLRYRELPSVRAAYASHMRFMREMGRPPVAAPHATVSLAPTTA